MNQLGRHLIACTTLLSVCSIANVSYARGEGGVSAGVRAEASAFVSKAQATNTSMADVQNAAQASNMPNTTDANGTPAATSPCQTPTLMDGSYLGAQVGYGSYRVRNNISFPFNTNPVISASNWAIGANIGYGKMLSPLFYLGGELFINANTVNESVISTDGTFIYTNTVSGGPTYGIGLLPGIKLTKETLTYIRLGFNRTSIKTYETTALVGGGSFSNNVSKNLNSFVLGVGMETLITSNYSLRGEFAHMFISTYNTESLISSSVAPSNNQYTLSVIYHA